MREISAENIKNEVFKKLIKPEINISANFWDRNFRMTPLKAEKNSTLIDIHKNDFDACRSAFVAV